MSNLANPPSATRSGRLIIQYVADLMLDASDSDSDAEIPVSEDESKLRLHETHLVPQWLDENSSEERSIRELKSETASVCSRWNTLLWIHK